MTIRLTILFLFGLLLIQSCADKKTAGEHYDQGLKYYMDSSFTAALKEFSIAADKDNKNALTFYQMGLCEIKLKQNKEALISLQNALNLDSSNVSFLNTRAKLKIALGDFMSALNDCNKACIVESTNPDLYVTKGLAYESMNDRENATISYEKALENGKKEGFVYYKLGVLKLSNKEVACDLLSKAGELGYMEAYELIKKNCNPRYKEIQKGTEKESSTKSKNKSDKSTQTVTSYGIDIPEIKIGDAFGNRVQDYKVKAISKKGDYHYQYNKKITSLVYGHKVDYLVVTVKNNVVVRYIFFLYPNDGEVGVPKQMADRFKKETGFALGKSGNIYGARVDNLLISISRSDDINIGGDRLVVSVGLDS